MERRVEELLKTLHCLAFTDAESIIGEIRAIVLSPSATSAQIAFFSSKLLNSEVSLLEFIKKNRVESDRLIWKTTSNALDLVSDYIRERGVGIEEYIIEIKEICLQLMASSTKSSIVKEAALRPLIKMIEVFTPAKIKHSLDPCQLFSVLLDNKLRFEERTMGSTLKGAIFNILGLLVNSFETELTSRLLELQKLMFVRLKEEIFKGAKTEEKTLAGILKGIAHALKSFNYNRKELKEIFDITKALLKPLASGRYAVSKASMKVLSENAQIFKEFLSESAPEVIRSLFELSKQTNSSIRYLGQETTERCLSVLSESLQESKDMATFEYILRTLNSQIVSKSAEVLHSTIRFVGVFSQAIGSLRGQDYLRGFLGNIMELSTSVFQDEEDEDFKSMIIRQRKLISLLVAYSDIARSMDVIPESALLHFSEIAVEIFRRNYKLYKKYRKRIYNAVAQLFSALYLHAELFVPWIRVFISKAMRQMLTIPEVFQSGDLRIELSAKLWVGLFEEECLNDGLLAVLANEIGRFYHQLILTLDLNYSMNDAIMEATSPEDQQLFFQASEFAQQFLPKIGKRLNGWVMPLITSLSKRISELPLLPSLYMLTKVVFEVCSICKYCELEPQSKQYIMNLVIDIIKKMQGYQDALLGSCIQVCLATPVCIVFSDVNNIYIFQPVILQALKLGLNHFPLAHTVISMLKVWRNFIPMHSLKEILPAVLPSLSPYLALDKISQEIQGQDDARTVRDKKKTLAFRVVKFLGSLGGESHYLVNQKTSELHLAWDTETRLKINCNFNQRTLELQLDQILPRLIHLTEHSTEKKIKVAALELLHALIIYMIGRSTQVVIPFGKIYQHLFPVVYRLATDVEIVARQLFEPLAKQLVRWFARSRSHEQPETMALIDALIECVCNPSNSALRNLASECIGEFSRYVIMYNPSPLINFKSLIRRIESLSNHPQPEKRKGSILCFKKILSPLSLNDLICEKFLLEVAHMIFITVKLCHYDKSSEEINEICRSTLIDLKALIEARLEPLMKPSEKRSYHKSIYEFLDWIWDLCKRPERLCREFAQEYWKSLSMLSKVGYQSLEKNKHEIPSYDFTTYESFEALINFSFWSSQSGFCRLRPGSLDDIIHKFIKSPKKDEDVIESLNALSTLIDYCIYFTHEALDKEFLLKLLIAPKEIGFYQQVETQKYNVLYETVCNKAAEIVGHMQIYCDDILVIWENLYWESERVLKIALRGLNKIFKTQVQIKEETFCKIEENLRKTMLECLNSDLPSNLRKGKIILDFFTATKIDPELLNKLLATPKFFQNSLDSLLNYVSSNWDYALPIFCYSLSPKPDQLLSVFVPLLEKCSGLIKSKQLNIISFTKTFIGNALPLFASIAFSPSIELSVGIIRVYCIFLEFTKDLSAFNEGTTEIKLHPEFYQHILNLFKKFLSAEQNLTVKKEAFRLLSVCWEYYDLILLQEVKPLFQDLLSSYFLPSTHGLQASKEVTDSEYIAKAFFELFTTIPNLPMLELLYPLIREEISNYEQEIKLAVSKLIQVQVVNQYEKTFSMLLEIFMDSNCDKGISDNLRWGLAKRILVPMIDECDEILLEKLIINHTHSLLFRLSDVKFAEIYDSKEYLFTLREKYWILIFFERFFSRMPSNVIKENIHKSLYGPGSQGNELTKQLITFCGKYRKDRPEKYEIIESITNSQEYIRGFCCANYSCLLTCIRKTQSQEKVYVNFLFREQNWKVLIHEKDDFGFTPQTYFSQKPKLAETQAIAQKISSVYISASLFSQDTSSIRVSKKMINEIKEEQKEAELEQDEINSSIIMKPLLEVIEKMEVSFGGSLDMPQWMQCIHSDLCNQYTYLSVKLFIIKIILNRPKTFAKWADSWIGPICTLMSGNNGGIGFHYFLRDVATLFLYDWEDSNIIGKEREASKFLNYLIKVGADTTKQILDSNLQIISGLIKKWKVPLEHKFIDGMMKKQIKDEDSKVGIAWKVTGIILYGVAVDEKVRILLENKENYETLDESLIKCLDANRRQVVMAAAEVIGKRLSVNEKLIESLLGALSKKENKEIGVYVNILEKISISYPKLLNDKTICHKLSALFVSLSGSTRSSLLRLMLNYTEYIKISINLCNIPDLSEYLYRDREKISNDNEDSHRLALLKLLHSLIDLNKSPSVKKSVSGYIPLLKSFLLSPNTEIRKNLYGLMRKAYDESKNLEEPLKIKRKSQEILLKGLTDSEHSDEIMKFLNDENRLSLNPQIRMLQCIREIYTPECEELWLVASCHLICKLTEISPDYNKVLFEYQLAQCNFRDMEVKLDECVSLPMTPMFSPSYYHQDSINKTSQKSSQFAQPSKPSRIRHLVEGSQASIQEKKEFFRKTQMEKLEKKIIEQRANQVSIVRNYRSGDLPDIEIKISDIMLPLCNLILLDCEIASQVWVCVSTSLFGQSDQEFKKKMIQGLNRVMELSETYNSSVISCIHRTARELVRRNQDFAKEINPKHVSVSGIRSMCYQSSIMLIQECLLRYENKNQATFAVSGWENPQVNLNTRNLWIALTKVYEKMGDVDTVKGLWLQMLRENSEALSDKIRRALDLKTCGEIKEAANELNEVLSTDNIELVKEIKNEYLESLAYLGKWGEIKNRVQENNTLKIKAHMRLNEFAELTELVTQLPPSSLCSVFPYEMSLLNITQADPDRARYYLDQEFSRFVEKWQSLNPLSYSARHKLVQKLQKIFELSEFLSIYHIKKQESEEEYSERIGTVLRGWKSRPPSIAMDDLSVWDDILFSRVLFFDKINSIKRLENEEFTEYASLLCADTSECPLKLGWLEVSERYLREALNRRVDKSRSSVTIYSPALRLRAKEIKKGSEHHDTEFILSKFDKLFQSAAVHKVPTEEKDQHNFLIGQLYKSLTKILIYRRPCESLPKCAKEAFSYLSQLNNSTSSLKFARFCDLLLREYEEDERGMQDCIRGLEVKPDTLAKIIVGCTLQAMKRNNQRAHDMFPRLIDLLKYPIIQEFKAELRDLPEWMIIKWISQILSIFDKSQCDAFSEIIFNLLAKYPQIFYYSYKTFTSVDSLAQFYRINNPNKSLTWKIAEQAIGNYRFLDEFTEALDFLAHPEQRFKNFVDIIKEAMCTEGSKDYLDYIAKEMSKSFSKLNKSGNYNLKFANDWEPIFTNLFGQDFSNLRTMNLNDFNLAIESINKKMNTSLSFGPEKLSNFSEWLADYGADNYSDYFIQIPGLYSGLTQPMKSNEVNIVSFNQSILILGSARRPKRIGIHGSDEKEYYVLVKGGEDLRLDQRIQQIFGIMNRIFNSDPECIRLSIKLKTFSIVPITKRLGLIEWISNTEPLKNIINTELSKHYKINDINETDANKQRLSWLSSLAANASSSKVQEHVIALGAETSSITKSFKLHETSIPWDLIRQGLLSISNTPESFMHVRKQFVQSLAVISIAGYIIGLGDRHLENFLLDKTDGTLMAIDFGVSFGSGIGLGIPELMPFRMTRQFISVLSPEGMNGQLRNTMIHCLKALSKHKNIVLDCCEVFINEPLQEWIKPNKLNSNTQQIKFLRKKIEVIQKKLSGGHSGYIMLEELENTKHASTVITI